MPRKAKLPKAPRPVKSDAAADLAPSPEKQCRASYGNDEQCDRRATRLGLCAAHYRQHGLKRPFTPIVGPHGNMGPRVPLAIRVSKDCDKMLALTAKQAGKGSKYQLSIAILEEWARQDESYRASWASVLKKAS